jgi:hypothetical protein
MKMAPSDGVRLQSYMVPATNARGTTTFADYQRSLNQNQDRATLLFIRPQDYDGTFVPSNSVRTETPPEPEAAIQGLWTPPWSVVKGV